MQGATAILIYATIQSPLSQPRNVLLGHTLCAVVGVCVAKLFEHVGEDHVNGHRWVIGALACAAGSVLMCLTNTIHPPGGATALMAVADPQISAMGWSYVPLILLAVVLMLLWALVLNNIQRQYPLFWWTPRDVGRRPAGSAAGADVLSLPTPSMKQTPAASVADAAYCCATTRELDLPIDPYRSIVITAQSVFIPPTFTLGIEQAGVLEVLRDKLRTVGPADGAATHVAA